jgi:hypothetical protein
MLLFRPLYYPPILLSLLLFACDGGGGETNLTETVECPDGKTLVGDACQLDCPEDKVLLDGLCVYVEPEEEEEEEETGTTDESVCTGRTITTINGLVQDASGAGASGVKAQACLRQPNIGEELGNMVCLQPSDTNTDGSYIITVPVSSQCVGELVMRVLAPGQDMSTSYCIIEGEDLGEGEEVFDLTDHPFVLFETVTATTIPEKGEGDSPRTVIFADGLEIDITPDAYFASGKGYEGIAAAWLDFDASAMCAPEHLSDLQGIYAFSPEGDAFQTTFPARIPDHLGLGDGTEVEVYVVGGLAMTLADGTGIRESEWANFANATIENGVIDLSGDKGIPAIGWLTYRAAQ